jgi:hypothetical protein
VVGMEPEWEYRLAVAIILSLLAMWYAFVILWLMG